MAAGSPYLMVTYAETNRILPEPYQRVLVAGVAVAALALPVFGNAYLIYLMNLMFLAVIGAVGLNLLTGYCGQVSLGSSKFPGHRRVRNAILRNGYGVPVLAGTAGSLPGRRCRRACRGAASLPLPRHLPGDHHSWPCTTPSSCR